MAGGLFWSVLPDDMDAIAEREALARVRGYRRIKGRMSNCRWSMLRPSTALPCLADPTHLDPEWQVGRHVVQVRVRQLPQDLVDAERRLGRCSK